MYTPLLRKIMAKLEYYATIKEKDTIKLLI